MGYLRGSERARPTVTMRRRRSAEARDRPAGAVRPECRRPVTRPGRPEPFGPGRWAISSVHRRAVPGYRPRAPRRSEGTAVTISVFLLDDHEIVRRGIAQLLESEDDIEVVGEAGTAAQALARIPALASRRRDPRRPAARRRGRDRLPRRPLGGDPAAGLPDAHLVLRRRGPVRRDHGRRVRLPAQAGDRASTSSAPSAPSPRAVHCSIRKATAVVLERLRRGDEPNDPRYASLSPQERRILELIADGLTNRQIGAEMYLAEKTVKNYVSSLLHKLGFARRTEAAVYATELNRRPNR